MPLRKTGTAAASRSQLLPHPDHTVFPLEAVFCIKHGQDVPRRDQLRANTAAQRGPPFQAVYSC